MRPIWLIEANVDGLPSEALKAEARRQGMAVHVVKHIQNLPVPKDIAGAEAVPRDACVVFRGSLPLMRYIQASRRWKPGGWCTFSELACSTYYAYFGPYLLNREYTLLPAAEALRLADSLFARYGSGGVLFIRPDSVEKNFNGKLADRATFLRTISGVAFDPTLLILVALPRQILREWRLIVANGTVVAGSQYAARGEIQAQEGCPDEVLGFATTVLQEIDWRPDPLFIMDVCESEDGLRLVELNSFSCSGHYLADVPTVVRTASELASCCW